MYRTGCVRVVGGDKAEEWRALRGHSSVVGPCLADEEDIVAVKEFLDEGLRIDCGPSVHVPS